MLFHSVQITPRSSFEVLPPSLLSLLSYLLSLLSYLLSLLSYLLPPTGQRNHVCEHSKSAFVHLFQLAIPDVRRVKILSFSVPCKQQPGIEGRFIRISRRQQPFILGGYIRRHIDCALLHPIIPGGCINLVWNIEQRMLRLQDLHGSGFVRDPVTRERKRIRRELRLPFLFALIHHDQGTTILYIIQHPAVIPHQILSHKICSNVNDDCAVRLQFSRGEFFFRQQ